MRSPLINLGNAFAGGHLMLLNVHLGITTVYRSPKLVANDAAAAFLGVQPAGDDANVTLRSGGTALADDHVTAVRRCLPQSERSSLGSALVAVERASSIAPGDLLDRLAQIARRTLLRATSKTARIKTAARCFVRRASYNLRDSRRLRLSSSDGSRAMPIPPAGR